MPFHLEITFAGMCLLAREMEPDRTPRMLHVLMPATVGDPHLPTLAYLTAHEPGSTETNPVTKRDVAGKQLDLSNLTAANGFDLTLPATVFDFGNAPLGPRQADLAAAGVRFRAKLTAGRYAGRHNPGGFWFVRAGGAETSHPMATAVTWRLANVQEDKLTLDLGGGVKHVLTPLPGPGGTIHLMIVNLTPEEHERLGDTVPQPTECPPDRKPGHHFTHYFDLLTPRDPVVTPEFHEARTRAAGRCANPPSGPLEPTSEAEWEATSEAEWEATSEATTDDTVTESTSEPLSSMTAMSFLAGSEFSCMVATAPVFR